jgi:hypothetical protein
MQDTYSSGLGANDLNVPRVRPSTTQGEPRRVESSTWAMVFDRFAVGLSEVGKGEDKGTLTRLAARAALSQRERGSAVGRVILAY